MRFEDIKRVLLIAIVGATLSPGFAHAQSTVTTQLVVPPDVDWTSTGLYVVKGDRLLIESAGPGFLYGGIGDAVFDIGPRYADAAPATGELYVGIRDLPGTPKGEMKAAIRASPARMPELRGRTPKDATLLLRRFDRGVPQQAEAYSSAQPRGLIFAQSVEPGTDMRQVNEIAVSVSLGPEPEPEPAPAPIPDEVPPPVPTSAPVLMPDVTNKPFADAQFVLRDIYRGPIERIDRPSTANFGYVFQQSPAPETDLRTVDKIVLFASLGEGDEAPAVIPMPDVTHRPFAEAESILRKIYSGNISKIERASNEKRGNVFRQQPAAGTDLSGVGEIVLHASTGPPGKRLVPVPDLVGLTGEEAEARVQESGLDPFMVKDTHRGRTGRVYDQTPAAGTRLAAGGGVMVYVSAPREIPWLPLGACAVLLVSAAAFTPKIRHQWWVRQVHIEPSIERELADVDGLSAPGALFSIGIEIERGEGGPVGDVTIERTEVVS